MLWDQNSPGKAGVGGSQLSWGFPGGIPRFGKNAREGLKVLGLWGLLNFVGIFWAWGPPFVGGAFPGYFSSGNGAYILGVGAVVC